MATERNNLEAGFLGYSVFMAIIGAMLLLIESLLWALNGSPDTILFVGGGSALAASGILFFYSRLSQY